MPNKNERYMIASGMGGVWDVVVIDRNRHGDVVVQITNGAYPNWDGRYKIVSEDDLIKKEEKS